MRKNLRWLIAALLACIIGSIALPLQAAEIPLNESNMTFQTYDGKVRAPEFPTGLDWLNTDQPITMAALRGKIVLLDFWTYGCVNCMHVIPDLQKLQAEYPNELVVIGVHSAKFSHERNTQNIREVTQRYGVTHPVVNDAKFQIWEAYGVRAWPTAMLIDPAGKVFGFHAGEGVYKHVGPTISAMIADFDARGQLNRDPLRFTAEPLRRELTALSYPSKVVADPATNRLFIADTNHNRIVITDLTTFTITTVIGSGVTGLQDGAFATAQFNAPQGLAFHDETLYIADTRNHVIRAADLRTGQVRLIAGTGEQNLGYYFKGKALKTELASPWDLIYLENRVYIAMSGTHQIWMLDLAEGTVRPYVGSSIEGIYDTILPEAQLAQPSGLASDGSHLYFADSESSAIRQAQLGDDGKGQVKTIVGHGLFTFGDTDGLGDVVRLQHPLGVTLGADGLLYIADTYNNKIKSVNPATREVKTIFGGEKGFRDGDGSTAQLFEPGGLHYAAGKLYIADTNNHAIRVADLSTGQLVTVTFPNVELLLPKQPELTTQLETPDPEFFGTVVKLEPIEVAPGAAQLVLTYRFPEGHKLNKDAPFTVKVFSTELATVAPPYNDMQAVAPPLPVTMPITLREGDTTLVLDSAVVYCEAINESLCYIGNFRFEVPLRVKADAAGTTITIDHLLTIPITK